MPDHKHPPSPENEDGYCLHPSQVPDFPRTRAWIDQLRWCVAVMDANDRDLGFAASLLSHAVDRGGLTDKQFRYASRLVERVHALWLADVLVCQRRPSETAPQAASLSTMIPKGQA
ncbi:hypothetical protein [Methylorubrum zatmanii]|uniref:DUF2285 domain-containing protein n=1 Tax=Methylorubrum zatmanii TaxID=29429 RepID=A0ABW1WJZ4_9HYPH|nr:hypothetical protein [Methylorubrum zatmanii]MBD8906540.1 hypothetical protein [Methylorubrum zatmanii]